MSEIETAALDEWMVVELLGHRRLAGRVREVQIAGAGFLRLDIPADDTHPAATQFVSPGSVYALHPTTETIVRAVAARYRPEPVSRWELAALPAAEVPPTQEDIDPAEELYVDAEEGPF